MATNTNELIMNTLETMTKAINTIEEKIIKITDRLEYFEEQTNIKITEGESK